MIVETMNHEEVYRELERDRETLTAWWYYRRLELQRRALKCHKFPLNVWYDYTSPRKVRYLIYTRIFDKRMRHILTGIVVPRRMSDGWALYTTWLGYQQLIAPMVVLPHALKRYAERAKVEKTGLDLIKHYFVHNSIGTDSHNQRVVARSVRYNGEEHRACCTAEGVLLGQQQGNIFVARTFITYDMCSGLQQVEFESKREQIMSDRELYHKAETFYRTGLTF